MKRKNFITGITMSIAIVSLFLFVQNSSAQNCRSSDSCSDSKTDTNGSVEPLQQKVALDGTTKSNACSSQSRSSCQAQNHRAVGKSVPDFEFTLLDGNQTVSRQDLLGQFYVLDFWWTGCTVCVSQIANLEKAYEKYGDENFTILSLSLDKDIETVVKFQNGIRMPWLNAHVRDQWQNRFTSSLMVHDLPKIFLVSPDGVILATGRELIGENLEKTLSKYLSSN